MARRRNPGAAMYAAMQPLQLLLQHQYNLREQANSAKLRGLEREQQNAFSLLPQVESGALKMGNMSPDLLSQLAKYIDVPSVQKLGQERQVGAIEGDIGDAKSLGDIPTPNAIRGKMQAAGVDISPQMGVMREDLGEGGLLPSKQMGPVEPDILKRVFETAQEKTNQLTGEERKRTTPLESIDPTTGQQTKRFVPTTELANQPPQITGLGAADLGRLQTEQFKAGEGSPTYIQSKADMENMMRTLTGPGQVQLAGQMAGAQASASERARMAPDLVQARVAEQLAGQRPLLGETNRQAQITPLITADAEARELEQQGGRIEPLALAMATNPLAGQVLGSVPFLDANKGLNKRYVQKAIDYAANYTFLKSGAQSTQSEYERFLYNLFATPSDGPTVIKQKQQTRAAFQAAQLASLSGGIQSASQILAKGMLSGMISPALFNQFQPDMQEAVGALIKVMQDDQGNFHASSR